MTYQQIKNIDGTINDKGIFKALDNAFIPFDPANTDYQAYLKFIADGGQPLPADEVTV